MMPKWLEWAQENLSALHRGNRGQDLIEYALTAALLSLMVVAASGTVAVQISMGMSSVAVKFKKHADRGLHLGWYK
jgi:Flp pilus assembly pilin Flp